MKKYYGLLIITVLVFSMIAGCAREPEVKVEKVEVAVVDQNKLWQESTKAEEYQQQLNDKIEELKDEYNTDIENLTGSEESTKQQEIYQEISDFRSQLKKEFEQDIAQAVEKIAKKEGYDVVLNKEEVRFGGTDITAEILDNL